MDAREQRPDETLVEVRVEVPAAELDAVCDFIVANICTGLVQEDGKDGNSTTVIFYCSPRSDDTDASMLSGYLVKLLGDRAPTVERRIIKNVVWEEEYRRSVTPVTIAGDVTVRPPWARPAEGTGYDIVIEPKMAFGTGAHETTRSCLQVIRERLEPGMRFLDMGCGSGILSILAGKMGASYIKAVDYDITAVENCRENFESNGVSAVHEILLGSMDKCRGDTSYDFVCANILKSTILEMLDQLLALTAVPGTLVLSGLLEQDIDDVYDALDSRGISGYETICENEWRTIIVERP